MTPFFALFVSLAAAAPSPSALTERLEQVERQLQHLMKDQQAAIAHEKLQLQGQKQQTKLKQTYQAARLQALEVADGAVPGKLVEEARYLVEREGFEAAALEWFGRSLDARAKAHSALLEGDLPKFQKWNVVREEAELHGLEAQWRGSLTAERYHRDRLQRLEPLTATGATSAATVREARREFNEAREAAATWARRVELQKQLLNEARGNRAPQR